jgi:hypothetical protein
MIISLNLDFLQSRKYYTSITLVPKDDFFKYAHDCKRLFSIMYLISSKDLHYLINQAFIDRDGVARLWSTFIAPPTLTFAKYALESIKIYDSNDVKENISLLQKAFLNLNTQPVPLTHDEMTYFLQQKFCPDGRIIVQSVMATSKAGNVCTKTRQPLSGRKRYTETIPLNGAP